MCAGSRIRVTSIRCLHAAATRLALAGQAGLPAVAIVFPVPVAHSFNLWLRVVRALAPRADATGRHHNVPIRENMAVSPCAQMCDMWWQESCPFLVGCC